MGKLAGIIVVISSVPQQTRNALISVQTSPVSVGISRTLKLLVSVVSPQYCHDSDPGAAFVNPANPPYNMAYKIVHTVDMGRITSKHL